MRAGAYQKFVELGLDSSYLPVWLQGAGYDTYIYGKFLNQYVERSRYQPPGYYPRGWTVFQALTHENTYAYYNSCFALNGSLRECFPGQYQTDLIKEMATGTIRATAALGRPRPFLLYLAPAAPHLESSPQRPMGWTTPRPARRHASLYADENVKHGHVSYHQADEDYGSSSSACLFTCCWLIGCADVLLHRMATTRCRC